MEEISSELIALRAKVSKLNGALGTSEKTYSLQSGQSRATQEEFHLKEPRPATLLK
jgi:hypothetical protein